jgi:hypothetical protein
MVDNNIVEHKGLYLPQDYSLNSLNLLVANGQKIELRKLMVEMSYYEDIYSFVVSGHITIMDGQGFHELLPLTGNEFIEINLSKTSNQVNGINRTFRLYKMGPKITTPNMNVDVYTLYFCSEEMILSEQNKLSKSYKGQKISDIIKNILTDNGPTGVFQLGSKRIQKIEETMGMYDFVVPKFKPFETISWLSNYARPQKPGPEGGADMLFFETKDGFNFRSLQSMFSDSIYAEYNYEAENLNKNVQKIKDKLTNVLDYEVSKPYDILNEIGSGTFASRIVTIDPLARSVDIKDFNYEDYRAKNGSLDKNAVSPELTNRLGKTQSKSPEGVLKLASGNSAQQDVPYVKQQGGVAKDINISTYVPNRTAQISLANYTTIKAVIPGDPGITAGRTIKFTILSLRPDLNKKDEDKYYSGKYLVSAVRHVISSGGAYQTVLELSKDSSVTKYPSINSSNPAWKKAVKS